MIEDSKNEDEDGDVLDVFKEVRSVSMIDNRVFDGSGDELEVDFQTLLIE